MASFHEDLFPVDVSYGSVGGPGFDTSIIEVESGQEQRVARRSQMQHKYDAAYGIKTYTQLTAVKTFYAARMGCAVGFLYKDWSDYTSNPTDASYRSAAGTQDQLIGTGNATLTQFQLIKKYTSGAGTITRTILKPVVSTVLIWVSAVLKTEGVDYTVDVTTGVVTMAVAPILGAQVHASFQFYVPVRFGKEIDDVLAISIDDFDSGSIAGVPLVEVLSPNPGSVGEYHYGGAVERAITVDLTVSTGLGRVWSVSSATAGKSIILPDPAAIPTGGPIFYINNSGGVNSIALKNHLGTTLLTLAANTGCEVLLRVDSTSAKVWMAQ